jgi:hypothetical protein
MAPSGSRMLGVYQFRNQASMGQIVGRDASFGLTGLAQSRAVVEIVADRDDRKQEAGDADQSDGGSKIAVPSRDSTRVHCPKHKRYCCQNQPDEIECKFHASRFPAKSGFPDGMKSGPSIAGVRVYHVKKNEINETFGQGFALDSVRSGIGLKAKGDMQTNNERLLSLTSSLR